MVYLMVPGGTLCIGSNETPRKLKCLEQIAGEASETNHI